MEPADRYCTGTTASARGPGRVVVQHSSGTGKKTAAPCWIHQTQYAVQDMYQNTTLGIKSCEPDVTAGLNDLLSRPENNPFSNSEMTNNLIMGYDAQTHVIEVTKAVWNVDGKYWRRFWRATSGPTLLVRLLFFLYISTLGSLYAIKSVWVEHSTTGNDWFPKAFNPELNARNPAIVPTNIPDGNTKQYYGQLPDGRTYLVSNVLYHPTTRERQPLVISIATDGVHFDWSRVLRTNAPTNIIPDSRSVFIFYGN